MGKITIDEDYLKFLLKQERIRGKVEWNSKISKRADTVKVLPLLLTKMTMELSDEVCDFLDESKKWIKLKD